jgi:hypothetical protein
VVVVVGAVPVVVLVVDPAPPPAGIELAQPGNRTVREKEPTAQAQSENVMLEAARVPVPEGAPGVSTAVTSWAGPPAW